MMHTINSNEDNCIRIGRFGMLSILFVVLVTIDLLVGVSAAWQPQDHVELRAKSFVVVDDNRKEVGRLGYDADGAHLTLLNEDGSVGASVRVKNNEPQIAVFGKDPKARGVLRVQQDATVLFEMKNSIGKSNLLAFVTPEGIPHIMLNHRDSPAGIKLVALGNGTSMITLSDVHEQEVVQVRTTIDGGGIIDIKQPGRQQ